jgi:DNA-binding transcriptional ArsR family regulator
MDNINLLFEALSSTPRRLILSYLSASSLTAGEISERFDMSKPALSKHLKILQTANLIVGEKKGQFMHYSLNRDNLVASLTDFAANFCPVGSGIKKESKLIAENNKGN